MSDDRKDETELHGWEAQINALLDGELDVEQTRQLKAAASQDQALAQAIIAAYQLQQTLEAIPLQKAPDSLRRKLAHIPQQHGRKARPAWFQPAWITALATIPLLVIALSLREPAQPVTTNPTVAQIEQPVDSEPVSGQPTAAQATQAQKELAIAFSYLEKVGRKTGLEIGNTVNSEMQETINTNMIRTLKDQMEFNKERNA